MGAQLRNIYLNSTQQLAAALQLQTVNEIYTGTDLDVNRSTTGTSIVTHTFVIEEIRNAIILRLLSNYTINGSTAGAAEVQIKIETSVKDAGVWNERFPYTYQMRSDITVAGHELWGSGLWLFEWAYLPTAAELAGGLDMRVSIKIISADNKDAAHTLHQAVICKF